MTKLSRETVIRAALDLLNEVGVDGLSTRRLAERLGVQQPALYWHFKNKRELLDALSRQMLVERHTRGIPQPGEHWRAFLHDNAMSFRRGLLAYRDGARIHAGTRPDGPQAGAVEAQLRLLRDAGFAPDASVHALLAVSQYTVGAVLEQQAAQDGAGQGMTRQDPPQDAPLLRAAMDILEGGGPDQAFEQGLALLLDGLACRLEQGGARPPARRNSKGNTQ